MLRRHLLNLLEDNREVVTRCLLERWELSVRLEFLHPHELADGQEVPVIQIRRARGGEDTAVPRHALRTVPPGLFERIARDVVDLSPGVRLRGFDRLGAGRAHHGVVELPVLVADGRWDAALVVEEVIAIALRFALEVRELVDTGELGLLDALVLALHDLLVQIILLRAAGDFYERG